MPCPYHLAGEQALPVAVVDAYMLVVRFSVVSLQGSLALVSYCPVLSRLGRTHSSGAVAAAGTCVAAGAASEREHAHCFPCLAACPSWDLPG